MAKKKKVIRPEKQEYTITANRFVGYIDIMGFKDLVARSTHNSVYAKMKGIAGTIKNFIQPSQEGSDGCKHFLFSDSIVIFSKDDSEIEMNEFMAVMRATMATLYSTAIPFKGAIAYGNMTVDDSDSIFFGQPLIDAHLLSEELAMYGIILHHTCEEKLKGLSDSQLDGKMTIPFKLGSVSHEVLVSGTLFQNHEHTPENICDKYRLMTSGALRKYIDNTEQYLNTVLEKQNLAKTK
jgi:hypothetical protein